MTEVNKEQFEKSSGTALLTGSLMMIVTMVLHPAGGSFEHLLRISTLIIVTHSLALISIPFSLFGFWGLTRRLRQATALADAAFITASLGMFAVLCAAALNGLALPLFIGNYRDATPEVIDAIRPVLVYNGALNHAFDFIFIAAICGAIILWSAAIISTRALPAWSGYLGLLISTLVICSFFAGFVFVDLGGFRIFIAGIMIWVIAIGVIMRKTG